MRLEVKELRSGYGRIEVVHDISIAVGAGESVGLFGGVTRRWERREERWDSRGWGDQSATSTPNPQQTDAYNRALDACLSARGYTVR